MNKFIISFLLSFPVFLHAADINCGGKVTMVLSGHSSCGDGDRMAFRADASPHRWQCSDSVLTDSVLLSAMMADKTIYVATSDAVLSSGQSCSDLPHYQIVNYVIAYK